MGNFFFGHPDDLVFSPNVLKCFPNIFKMAYLLLSHFDRDVKLEYKNLKEKMKEYNKKDAKFYGNMFAKMAKSGFPDSNVSALPLLYVMLY